LYNFHFQNEKRFLGLQAWGVRLGLLTMLVENNKNFRAAGAASARCRRA
jgi:hypothetical protein